MESGGMRSLLLDKRGRSVQRGTRLSGAFGDPRGLRDPLAAWEAGWWEVPRCRAWQGLAGAGRGGVERALTSTVTASPWAVCLPPLPLWPQDQREAA